MVQIRVPLFLALSIRSFLLVVAWVQSLRTVSCYNLPFFFYGRRPFLDCKPPDNLPSFSITSGVSFLWQEVILSFIPAVVNANYPNDVDATILTGFSHQWLNVVPGFIATALLLPAPGLPIGYLHATSESGTAFLLQYAPYYDTAFFHQDFANRGTITVGEGVSGALGITAAPQYAKPVFVITGQQDTVFCGSTGLQLSGPGNCGSGPSGVLAQTKSLYSNRKANYTYYALNDAGHCWEHGNFAQQGFYESHKWMYEQGF